MQKLLNILLIAVFSIPLFGQVKSIEIGEKHSIRSEILNEERFFNIYLPPSYYSTNITRYPVIYLMDGDYNFHHTTGLVEQLSSIGEKIPEMIVVGISDNGHEKYMNNCTPFNEESNKFLNFLNDELKDHINRNFRTADFEILIGHSIGGLFTVNALLNNPLCFNVFIAISPSLWWNDYETEKKIVPFFEKHDSINRHLFLSLADEKGMGVLGFQNQLDINTFADEYYKNKPLGLNYSFTHYPDENHNSVGLITVNKALKKLFSNYDTPTNVLQNLQSFNEYEDLFSVYTKMLGDGFRFPNRQLKTIMNSFYNNNFDEVAATEKRIKEKYHASLPNFYNNLGNILVKNGKLDEGIKLLKTNCSANPNSAEFLTSLANAYTKAEKFEEAKEQYKIALEIAEANNTRNWYMNQLRAIYEKTK